LFARRFLLLKSSLWAIPSKVIVLEHIYIYLEFYTLICRPDRGQKKKQKEMANDADTIFKTKGKIKG